MPINHEAMVWLAKTAGLLYLVALSAIVIAYAYWPSKKAEFRRVANSILETEDKPWR